MLELSVKFFEHLNASGIEYCHWKSNCRLAKSLEGRTDLDLLVARKDQAAFEAAARKFDLKKVLTDPRRRLQDVEDYLGMDRPTGRLIHLHVHYRLVLGERFIKNHVLPIERLIFDNLVTEMGVRIPCPEIELMLLVVRAHMKIGFLPFLRFVAGRLMGRKNTPYPDDIVDEIRALAKVSDPEKLSRLLLSSGIALKPELVKSIITGISEGATRPLTVLGWRKVIMSAMKRFRRETGPLVRIRYYSHCLRDLPGIKNFFSIRKKALCGPGRIISIVGADGSGKSTLVEELDKWLSWKLEVKRAYYGIPKTATVSAWRTVIAALAKLRLTPVAALAGRLHHVYIANKRYRIHTQTLREAASGYVVITDRFPMAEFNSMDEPMDGQRLANEKGFLSETLSGIEAGQYAKIARPDRIFVLQAALSVLRARKDNLPVGQHKAKVDAVNSLKPSKTVRLINGARPYEEVLLDVKTGIWEAL